MKRLFLFLCLLITVFCSQAQNPQANADTSWKKIYRESYPRINDLVHTKLEVKFDYDKSWMYGKAWITLRPHFYATDTLALDAKGMDIKKVAISKSGSLTPLKYDYDGYILNIKLNKTYKGGEEYTVYIDYTAKPNEIKVQGSAAITDAKGLYFINPKGEEKDKPTQIWTQGETEANSVWFPTIDKPNQKTTDEIYMTVPEKYVTLSNGILVSQKKNSDGTRTDYWKMDLPHAPYLFFMGVGDYAVIKDSYKGKEVSYYVEKEFAPVARKIFGLTPEMIAFYSKITGMDYVWPKYSQIVGRDYVSGAMENTTATLHQESAQQDARELVDGNSWEEVIAHELFHQWFGDLVTTESWSNLTLNESFANYSETLWNEYKHGKDAGEAQNFGDMQGYLQSRSENKDLVRFRYSDKEDMFDAVSYNKGGQVLHMLRKAVGDEAFFASLKLYLESNKFKNGEIHQLRLAFEEITGKDMNWFFNQWFLNKGRPKLEVNQVYNLDRKVVELNLKQTQNFSDCPLYTLPMDVDVYVNGNVQRTRITMDEASQTFYIPCEARPDLVNVDAERQLLCEMEYKKTTETYVFQYRHAPLYGDRIEALKELEKKLDDPQVYELFKQAATKDKYYVLRSYALQALVKSPENKSEDLKSLYASVYASDPSTLTRTAALEMLNQRFLKDADVQSLNEKALGEASYAICSEGLQGIYKFNKEMGFAKAKQFENESGKDLLTVMAAIYAEQGADEQIGFFHKSLKYFNGFDIMNYLNYYVKTAKRCTQSSNVIIASMDLETLNKGAGRFMKFATMRGIKELCSAWEAKETAARAKVDALKQENKDSGAAEKELASITETKGILTATQNRMK